MKNLKWPNVGRTGEDHFFVYGIIHNCGEPCPANHSEGQLALLGRARSVGDYVESMIDSERRQKASVGKIHSYILEVEAAWHSQGDFSS